MEPVFITQLKEEHEHFGWQAAAATERKINAQQKLEQLQHQIIEEELKISWAEDDFAKYSKMRDAAKLLLEWFEN